MTTAQEESLQELSTDSNLLEIQGVTLDRNHIRVLGIYAFLSIIPTGLFYFWPQAGAIASTLSNPTCPMQMKGQLLE